MQTQSPSLERNDKRINVGEDSGDSSVQDEAKDMSWLRYNTQAALHIQQAKYGQAEELLSKALTDLAQNIDEGVDDAEMDDEEEDDEILSDGSRTFSEVQLSAIGAKFTKSAMMQQELCSFDLYDRILVVRPDHSQNDDNDDEHDEMSGNESFWYCLVMYNMGLCLHLSALSSGNDAKLKEALFAYETAIEYLEDEDLVDDKKLWLEMALANNCCHIYSCFSNFDKTRDFVFDVAHGLLRAQHGEASLHDSIAVALFSANVLQSQYLRQRHAPVA